VDMTETDVDRCWQAFLRRFDIEHTFRLFKQTLGWTAPKLRDPHAADRWTWLMITVHTQLRLARPLATDLRRPWEKPTPPERLTPARVRRGFATSTRRSPLQPVHRNPPTQAPDDHPAPKTRTQPHATTSDASSPQARHTNAPPTTRKAPNPDGQVKDQAKNSSRYPGGSPQRSEPCSDLRGLNDAERRMNNLQAGTRECHYTKSTKVPSCR
jgi:hypothetical protein